MSGKRATALGGLALAALCSGCVMPDQMSRIEKELADIKNDVRRLEQDQARTREQVDALNRDGRDPGDLATRAQLADVDARTEQAARNSEINEERLADLARQLDRVQRDLEQTRAMAERGALAPPAVEGAGEDSDYPAGGADPTLGSAGPDPDVLYNTAYADFSKGNYDLAVSGFEEFYDKFPQSAVADNALYWIGECYFSQGEFARSIRAFDRLLDRFPDTDKAAAGNLKKGLAYLEQNQVRQAIVQLQHVYSTYAGTDEARVARDKLTALGAPI